ncbi:CMGC family protein kinase [Histomonas meleagridis]|uniref:CMGC family protein kinase n=1 Tax=Histomonas meleagridis TaxID=135588 RepID=UPI003559D97F|nr:CMGC family protein kinase [Histomonas meleagridis]KAH0806613.1 CMGC family protein kinase [Histomonas meleagridis]
MKHKSHSHITNHTTKLETYDGYTPISTIGIGTFGAVFLANDSEGNKVAIKKVYLDPKFKNRELDIVCKLKHPNCLQYITHYTTKEGTNNSVYLHLVTGYLPESLTTFLNRQPFPLPLYIKIFGYQLFAGLSYLHHHGVCHRDIKPSNVLVDPQDGRLQICDFGSAKFLLPNEVSVSYISTRCYRAPELLLDCPNYTTAIDTWAAGCVLAEMVLQGKPLFYGSNNNELLNRIMRIIGPPQKSDLDTFVHKKQISFFGGKIRSLRAVLPNYVQDDFVDLLQKIFLYAPDKRLTADECMKHPFFAELFNEDVKVPGSNMCLPEYLKLMRTPEEMIRNFPNGPKPPVK